MQKHIVFRYERGVVKDRPRITALTLLSNPRMWCTIVHNHLTLLMYHLGSSRGELTPIITQIKRYVTL